MNIYPIAWDEEGEPTHFESDAVYTTICGVRYTVSKLGFAGRSPQEIIHEALDQVEHLQNVARELRILKIQRRKIKLELAALRDSRRLDELIALTN